MAHTQIQVGAQNKDIGAGSQTEFSSVCDDAGYFAQGVIFGIVLRILTSLCKTSTAFTSKKKEEKMIYIRPVFDPLQRSNSIPLYFLWISSFLFTMIFFIRRNFGFCVVKNPWKGRVGVFWEPIAYKGYAKNKQTYTAPDIIESIGKLRWCAHAKWNASVERVGSRGLHNVTSLELSALEFVKGHLFKPNKIKLIIQVIQAFRTNLVKAFLDNLIYYH